MPPSNVNKHANRHRSRPVKRGLIGAVMLISLAGTSMIAAAQQQNAPPPTQTPYFAQHAVQAGTKNCAAAYPELGAMVTQGANYSVVSSWNKAAPDAHPIQGLTGIAIESPQYSGPAAAIVFAAPTVAGCAGNAVRIVPFPQACAVLAKQLPTGSHLVRNLSGTDLYEIGGGTGQVMLMSGGADICIAISVNRMES